MVDSQKTRTEKAKRNVIFACFSQVLKIALSFIARLIFISQLGVEYLGVNSLFANILSVLSIADLGITAALMYSLYKPLAEGKYEKVAKYLKYFKKLFNLIALTVAIMGVALIPFLHLIVNLPDSMPGIYSYYVLLLVDVVISYLFVYKIILLQADQKSYIIDRVDIISRVLLFCAQAVILFLTKSFALYLVCSVIATFLGNIFKINSVNKIYPGIRNTSGELSKSERKGIFKNISSLFLYKIGGVIQSNTDSILISIYVGTIAVGFYSNYLMIVAQVITLINMVFIAIKASVGNHLYSKENDEKYKMFRILEVYNFWIVGFCAVCFYILMPDFIRIFFGEEFVMGQAVLICIIANFYTSNIRQTLWTYRETSGVFSKTKYITLVVAILNLALSLVMGYFLGLVGVVLATVIARMIYAWWREPMIIYKDVFERSSKSYFVAYIARCIIVVLLCFVLEKGLGLINLGQLGLIGLFVKAIVIFIIFVLLMFIIYRKSDAMVFLKEKILGRRGTGEE